jgi:hypothetical protein
MDKENVVYMYNSSLKKNGIMLFARKWLGLVIILLSKISHVKKPNITYFCPYVEYRHKMMMTTMMIIIMGHEYKRRE